MVRLAAVARLLPVCLALVSIASSQTLERANWGEKFNTAGMTLRLMETQRSERAEGGTWVHYFLQAPGMPRGGSYSVWSWDVGGEPQLLVKGVSLRDDFVLLCSGKPGNCSGATEEQVYVLRVSATKAEPKRYAIVSADGTQRAFAVAVPFPDSATDKTCTVSVQRKTPDASEITLRGEGFAPGERVTLSMTTETTGSTLRTQADAKGNWTADAARTANPAQPNGTTQIAVKAKQCAPSVAWNWGPETQKLE